MQRDRLRLSLLAVAFLLTSGAIVSTASATPATKVYLNGRPAPVYFNDGDSFRVLAGPLAGTKARLAGFNTLESYGPVHQWGGWTGHELYRNAKMGTLNARRGVWHCTSDMKRDGYGRLLWWCPDLAEDQIRKGYAHVMSVTSSGGHPRLVRAQAEAIRARRGMWFHGVPEYILTSTHSNDEGYEGKTYNRLVSTKDGHSKKWYHKDIYGECQVVCSQEVHYDEAALRGALSTLRADARLAAFQSRYTDAQWLDLLRARLADEKLGGLLDEAHRAPIEAVVDALREQGALGKVEKKVDSCMTYAPFNRRYGSRAAPCMH